MHGQQNIKKKKKFRDVLMSEVNRNISSKFKDQTNMRATVHHHLFMNTIYSLTVK